MQATTRPLIIGTRASRLARTQTGLVVAMLRAAHGDGLAMEVRTSDTEGDRSQASNAPLADMAGRGVFVKDLERSLADGSIDLAVHSLKDVTTDLAEGMAIVAIPQRADPRDVLVTRSAGTLAQLPAGARIGTSSPRRAAQLAAARPGLDISPIRGNVDTRLQKLDRGDYDAVVLAAAGLVRLGLGGRITEYLEPAVCMPDAGQGALAIEARADDSAVAALLAPLDHAGTHAAVTAERALLRCLGGGCSLPVGTLATLEGAVLTLQAVVCSPNGSAMLRGTETGPAAEAEAIGGRLAQRLLDQGAQHLLEGRSS